MKKWQAWSCILLGLGAALGLRRYYGSADSDALLWILMPTAWWTGILGGPAFVYESGVGYVNHEIRFIIAPSCAGVRFLSISLVMLIGAFVPRMKGGKQGAIWTALCFPGVWLYTGFINGVRMVLSIYLPEIFRRLGLLDRVISWERLHTVIGTAVYFAALLALYQLGEWLCRKIGGAGGIFLPGKNTVPALWYFFMVLGIPFLRRVPERDYTGFGGYAAGVLGVCLGILCLSWLSRSLKEKGVFFYLEKKLWIFRGKG